MKEFEDIYHEYASAVKKFLLCITGDSDLTEDLMQETFYQAIKSIDRYNGTCKFSVWLCQIAKHLYYDELKKRKHHGTIPLEEWMKEETSASAESLYLSGEGANEIVKIAQQLPEPYGHIFLLRVLGEFSFREIGELYKKDDSWARVVFYRAKVKVKEQLSENEDLM